MELEDTPKWRFYVLMPIIGVGVIIGVVLLKLSRQDHSMGKLEMTDERRRLLIRAERDHHRMAEEGKEFS